jgi:hypothetical protein
MESKSNVGWFSSLKLRLRELKIYIKNILKIEMVNSDKENLEYARHTNCIKD